MKSITTKIALLFGLLIRNPQFRFTGRNRRPPLDPR